MSEMLAPPKEGCVGEVETIAVPGGVIDVHDSGLLVTRYGDGLEAKAWPLLDQGYVKRALDHGYGDDVHGMNAEHEAGHHLLAGLLGLPCSPTVRAAASGRKGSLAEEGAVLALQAYARTRGVDLLGVLRRRAREVEVRAAAVDLLDYLDKVVVPDEAGEGVWIAGVGENADLYAHGARDRLARLRRALGGN